MQLIKEKCTGCGYCVLVCPYDALKSNGWAEVIPQNCTNCNLCVYACPSDCFVPAPDFPLKPYTPRVKDSYDVVVVGSGIGGLMAALALARSGYSVAVFEKLGFPGGRYTEIDYKGAAVTTGAWTNLGPKSHIGRFLTEMGIDLDYVSLQDVGLTEQYSIRFPDGRHFSGLFDLLTPQARKAWLKAIITGRQLLSEPKRNVESATTNLDKPPLSPSFGRQRGGSRIVLPPLGGVRGGLIAKPKVAEAAINNPSSTTSLDAISTADYISEFGDDPDLLAAVDAIAATASGLNSQAIPASEYIQITVDGREAGREFAMPVGGVRSIIKALVTALRQAGGHLFVRSPVAQISVAMDGNQRQATGVRLESGRHVRSKIVLHNGGPGAFVKLARPKNLPQDYLDRLSALQGVECAALFCATREPLFADAPITMTPNCQRVVGIFSPTIFDPDLSKEGLHLFDAFFPTYSADRTAELELALADLRDLFPNFDGVLEWSVPMFFTGAWPGTESGQTFGQTGNNRLDPATPIENCYLVGMDVKGSGVAGDLIPIGVRRLLEIINRVYRK